MKKLQLASAVTALVLSTSINASTILVSQGTLSPAYGYGGDGWSNMTSFMDAAVDGGVIDIAANFNDLSLMLGYDALWLDTRTSADSLSSQEISNITSFIATGRRVVLNGENSGWTTWNQSILDTVGGTYSGSNASRTGNSVISNSLTDGVDSIYLPAAGIALGGTALFDQNAITLWGNTNNVVSMLDVNACSNYYIAYNDNSQFCGNLATWVASPSVSSVPVPAAVWLFGSGLIGLAGVARRKKA